jgi:hypothetical protein
MAPKPRTTKRKAVLPASRAPSSRIASARRTLKKKKQAQKAKAESVEARHRAKGGYGKAMCSPWEVPKGGIKQSPAYKKMLVRCGCVGSTPPAPKDRAGAPLKGGFPVEKWPPNVLVDGQRCCWLPDDWGQAIKNTGPGGFYLGWMSPEGKFFYHRRYYPTSIEAHLGRKLTALDGINGVRRSVSQRVPPGADKAFLEGCLTAAERKHVLGANHFHFAVISARRAALDDGQHAIMLVEGYCQGAGITPTWYVDKESLADYKNLGLKAVVGGKLTPARNMALDTAKRNGQVCVQISDDISKWEYFDVEKQNFSGETGFGKMNAAVHGSRRLCISPLAAAQFILAKMRSSLEKPQLGGVFPTLNAAMSLGNEEYSTHHFILGDFFVAEPTSPCRFDTSMTLKEDYDYSCSHIKAHGSVLRCNRMFAHARHATNKGGAVATRDATGAKERANIAILQRKWPGVFYLNGKRKDEVIMKWGGKAVPRKSSNATSAASSRAKPTKKAEAKAKGCEAKANMMGYRAKARVKYTSEKGYSSVPYINRRCAKLDGKSVEACIQTRFKDAAGRERPYRLTDLKYDEAAGRLRILK